jgi:hypothetical protein
MNASVRTVTATRNGPAPRRLLAQLASSDGRYLDGISRCRSPQSRLHTAWTGPAFQARGSVPLFRSGGLIAAALRSNLVFPLGLRLGDALALPLQLDLALPRRRGWSTSACWSGSAGQRPATRSAALPQRWEAADSQICSAAPCEPDTSGGYQAARRSLVSPNRKSRSSMSIPI